MKTFKINILIKIHKKCLASPFPLKLKQQFYLKITVLTTAGSSKSVSWNTLLKNSLTICGLSPLAGWSCIRTSSPPSKLALLTIIAKTWNSCSRTELARLKIFYMTILDIYLKAWKLKQECCSRLSHKRETTKPLPWLLLELYTYVRTITQNALVLHFSQLYFK